MVIVGAIDLHVVEQRADAANREQPKAVGVGDDTRSEQREVRPASPVDGQIVDGLKRQVAREIRRFRIDQRGRAADLDGGAGRGNRELGLQRGCLANLNYYRGCFVVAEPADSDRDRIRTGLKLPGGEKPSAVGSHGQFGISTLVQYYDFRATDGRSTLVLDRPIDGAGSSGLRGQNERNR